MVVSLQVKNSAHLFFPTNQIPKGRSIVFEPMVDYPQVSKGRCHWYAFSFYVIWRGRKETRFQLLFLPDIDKLKEFNRYQLKPRFSG